MKRIHYSFILLVLGGACTPDKSVTKLESIEQELQSLTAQQTEAEKADDLEGFLARYAAKAISMPEYQPTLTGQEEIKAYYEEIFRRQQVISYQRKTDEFIHLDSTIVEFGTFEKEYREAGADTAITQKGKYCYVWEMQPDGQFKIKGEGFGFFHHVENPGSLVVDLDAETSGHKERYSDQPIPFELRAYNALNEKYVRLRNGALRSEFYSDEAKFMPFAEPTVSGMEEIKPYLIEYTSRGEVTIDSIAVYTFHFEMFGDHLLEYAKFKVKWTRSDHSGRTEGKGIRIWQRQEDHSLKLFRQIGMHNHLENN